MKPQVPIDRAAIAEVCRRHHIRRLSLFGSVLREDFNEASDIDALYVLEDNHSVGWNIVTAADELAELLGHPVDLVPEKYLHRYLRDRVLREAEVLYDAA